MKGIFIRKINNIKIYSDNIKLKDGGGGMIFRWGIWNLTPFKIHILGNKNDKHNRNVRALFTD